MEKLRELLRDAGHGDFRDARGPLGFTQRQAAGRFTRDEADELIARLETEAEAPDAAAAADPVPAPVRAPRTRVRSGNRSDAEVATALHRVPAELLAAELQRRGWVVMEP